MSIINLKVIPEPLPGTRAIIVGTSDFDGPLMKGNGTTDFICGTCKNVLLKGINLGQVNNVVFKCGKCNNYNEI